MKKIIVSIILIGMLSWAVYDFGFKDESKQNDSSIGIQVGDLAPDFKLETLVGEHVKLSDFRGKNVMLNFWATWCPPCRAEMPDMERFYNNKDIVVLAVNLTESETNPNQVGAFVEEYGLSFPILLDKTASVSDVYEVNVVPTSFMIDEEGIIRYKTFGPMNEEMMNQEYDKLKH